MRETLDTPSGNESQTFPSNVYEGKETVIAPSRLRLSLRIRELWEYRELLILLTQRDIKVRYKQTILGPLWAIIRPFVTMVVFSIVFGQFAQVPTGDLPYPLFSYAGLLPWNYFADSIAGSGSSLVRNAKMLRRVYFPRLILPATSVLIPVVDFFFAFTVLIGMMVWYEVFPTWRILTLPLFLFYAFVAALSASLWLSALNVVFRDVQLIIPFIRTVWLFLTPVAYSLESVPELWRNLYLLNPMTGVVVGFRWALFGTEQLDLAALGISLAIVLVIFAGGLIFFNYMERLFADVV